MTVGPSCSPARIRHEKAFPGSPLSASTAASTTASSPRSLGSESTRATAVPDSALGLGQPLLLPTTQQGWSCPDLPAPKPRNYWESSLVFMAMYSGYASLFALQHVIKEEMGIADDDVERSYAFSAAVSCVFITSLVLRLGHTFLFFFLSPRGRVFLSMSSMLCSMLTIAVVIMSLGCHQICWVVLAYSLGGIGIGCFESNFLSCITPLGHETKQAAITGIPVGITVVTVGGFFLMGPPFFVPPCAIYSAAAALVAAAVGIVVLRIPATDEVEQGASGLGKFGDDVREFRQWLPRMWHHALMFALDLLVLALFCPGVLLYVYDAADVTLLPDLVLPTSTFLALVSLFNMLGSTLGRWLSYRLQPRHPVCYTIFTVGGVLLLLLMVPMLVPVGVFLAMVGDGLIYGSVSRHIDGAVPRRYNLVAISLWLLLGDVGAIIGSNCIYSVRLWILGP